MRSVKKYLLLVIICLSFCFLTACDGVKASGELVLHDDGSGSRSIVSYIWKNDNANDGSGITYYYLKIHGGTLENYLKNVYGEKIPGSENWLSVEVDDSNAEYETVTLSFEFSSLTEYLSRLQSLVFNEKYRNGYVVPEFEFENGEIIKYTESDTVMTGILNCIKDIVMADSNAFDVNCTKNGIRLNTEHSFDTLSDNAVGVLLEGNGNGIALTVLQDGEDKVQVKRAYGEMVYYKRIPGKKYYTLACVGDSITEGMGSSSGLKGKTSYPAVLQDLLNQTGNAAYTVYNYGASATTALNKSYYPYKTTQDYPNSLKSDPDVVIICFGANDAAKENWNAEKYKSDYTELIREYQNLPTHPTVYLYYTTYIKDEPEEDFRDTIQNQILGIQDEIAKELGLKIIDLNTVTRNHTDKFADGSHPNDELYGIIAEYVFNALCSEEVLSLKKSDAFDEVTMIDPDSQAGIEDETVVSSKEESVSSEEISSQESESCVSVPSAVSDAESYVSETVTSTVLENASSETVTSAASDVDDNAKSHGKQSWLWFLAFGSILVIFGAAVFVLSKRK